jgi:hypothetical protein
LNIVLIDKTETFITKRYSLEPNKIYTWDEKPTFVKGFRIVMPLTEAGKAIGNTIN